MIKVAALALRRGQRLCERYETTVLTFAIIVRRGPG